MGKPVVGITACRSDLKGRIHHIVQEKYVGAVSVVSEALPLLVPALGRAIANDDLLDSIDGLLLTGSPSNVLPRHYGHPPSRPGTLHDPHRDETTLPLVRRCIERAIPMLAVCRGFQEVNVAFGGTLHQHVHELPGMLDHRKHQVPEIEGQYAPAHTVALAIGGMLHRLVGRQEFEVNSLHWQGVDRLARRARGGGAGAGRPYRGNERGRIGVVRAGDSMASGVERTEGSGLARHLHGVRRRVPRARRAPCRTRGNGASANRVVNPHATPSRPIVHARADGAMSHIERWCRERAITEVEALMPDMSGVARGKVVPVAAYCRTLGLNLPEALVLQTVTGDYPEDQSAVDPSDRDIVLHADERTIRLVPWAAEPTAQVIHDCFHADGAPVTTTPRYVLRRVLDLYREHGWRPVVAPELEFYLVKRNADADYPLEPPQGRSGQAERGRQSYGIDALNEYDPLVDDIYDFCEAQEIELGTLSHEAGVAQLEINLSHGDPLELADQAFLFKRTVREAATRHGVYATFMAKPMESEPGSAMHIHQSVVDADTGENVFANGDGTMTPLFHAHIGGLQRYLPAAMSFLAPKRQFLPPDHEVPRRPDQRAVGHRQPDRRSARPARRGGRDPRREPGRRRRREPLPRDCRLPRVRSPRHDPGTEADPRRRGQRLQDALRAAAQPGRIAAHAAQLDAPHQGARRTVRGSLERGEGVRAPGVSSGHQLMGARVSAAQRVISR